MSYGPMQWLKKHGTLEYFMEVHDDIDIRKHHAEHVHWFSH